MRISTIIPAYNRVDLIGETLRSVLEQDRQPDEVIVVDDGSSDGTPDVVAAYGKAVTLIRQANAGAGAARNIGFWASTGDIVHFMDSDDLVSLNFYAGASKAIMRGADMTYGPWLKTRIEGRALDPEPFVLQQGPVASDQPLDLLVLALNWLTVLQPCLFRRDLVARAGPYRTDLAPSEDMEMLYRIMATARTPVHVADTLLLYRIHPENQVSAQDLPKRLLDNVNLWTIFERHAAGRSDLDSAWHRRFRQKKYNVACDVRLVDSHAAAVLGQDATLIDRLVRSPRKFSARIAARLRVMLSGNPYPTVLAAAPLTPAQRGLIHDFGYFLPDEADEMSAAAPTHILSIGSGAVPGQAER